MKWGGHQPLSSAIARVRADLRDDRLLRYILLLSFLLSGFCFWYRAPNFARPDEFSRLVDAMVAANHVFADPGFETLQRGISHGRAFGASFYLSALVLVPAYLIAVVTGQLDYIVAANGLRSRWEVWNTLPEWFWTTSLYSGRILIVLFAVGCVYLTYRIGIELRDRTTGRFAALLLTLSFSFLRSAHEFGEDVPALFCTLLVIFLALRYIETGDPAAFLGGCAAGGLAIAFKLTAGVVVPVLGVAYLLHARNAHTRKGPFSALVRPRLLVAGGVFGVGAVIIGFPSVIVSGLDPLVERLLVSTQDKSTVYRHGQIPIWGQFVLFYAGGLGVPLAIAAGGSVLVNFLHIRNDGREADATVLLLTALGVYLLVFSRWVYVQPHHLLPTFPLLALFVAAVLSRCSVRQPTLARSLMTVLVVTSGLYAGIGVLGYTTTASDETTAWIATEMPENATMDVFVPRFQTAAPLHGRSIGHYVSPEMSTYDRLKGEGWSPGGFSEWRHRLATRETDYIHFPAFGWRLLPDYARKKYTVVARFDKKWPLRRIGQPLGWKRPYPEFLPSLPMVIMERSERCGRSPTCSVNNKSRTDTAGRNS